MPRDKNKARKARIREITTQVSGDSGTRSGAFLATILLVGITLAIMFGVSAIIMVYWNGVTTKMWSVATVIDYWTAFWYVGFWAGIVVFYALILKRRS